MNFQRGQVKREVREAMKHTRPRPIWVTLFFLFIVGLVGGVISGAMTFLAGGGILTSPDLMRALFSGNYNTIVSNTGPGPAIPPGTMIYMAVIALIGALLTNLWQASMDVGYTDYCMDMVQGRNPGIDKLFAMLRHAWPIVVTQFLVGLFAVLWICLFYVAALFVIGIGAAVMAAVPQLTVLGVVLMIAAMVAMVIGMLWAVLRYAMVNYLMVDQGMFGLAAIRESKRLMKGHLLQYVGMHLSFILWYLPAIIGSGILSVQIGGLAGETVGNAMIGVMDETYMMDAIYGLIGTIALFGLFLLIQMILNLYLTPYVTGTEARFYFCLTGADVSAPRQQDWTPPMPPVNGPYGWTDEFPSSGQGTYTDSAAPQPQEPPRELPQQPAVPEPPAETAAPETPPAPPAPPAQPDPSEAPAEPTAPQDPQEQPDEPSARSDGPET